MTERQVGSWEPLRCGLLYPLLREGVEVLHTHVLIIRASSDHLATLLLGGAVSEVRLTSCDRLPSGPGAALADDAMSVVSDDLSVVSARAASSAESQSGPQQYLFQKQGCYAVARVLERVSVLRRVVLDELVFVTVSTMFSSLWREYPPHCRVATQHGA